MPGTRVLATVSTLLSILALSAGANARENGFHFVDGAGFRELLFADQPIYRYVTPAYDPSNRDATLKPFMHVYGLHNEGFITKGAGGMETHHRGLFFGFKTQYGNFWACNDGHQQQERYVAERQFADAHAARMASVVDWITKDGKPVVRDTREVTATRPGDDAIVLDFDIVVESLNGDIELGGDPHHAGFHFRAAEEVQGPSTTKPSIRSGLATYVRSAQAKLTKNDEWLDTAWAAGMFSIKGNPYVVIHMNDPSNPGPVTYSTRPYGRFGAFFTTTLKQSQPLHLRYRIVVLDGKTHPNPTVETLSPLYDDFLKSSAGK
jgi:hypothetical protein